MPRGPAGEELGELGGESLEVGGRGEGQLRVERKRQEPLRPFVGARLHPRDVPDDAGRQMDQMFGSETIPRGSGDRRRRGFPQHARIDDERARADRQHSLDEPAALPFLDELQQARVLQRAQVVVHELPRHPEL